MKLNYFFLAGLTLAATVANAQIPNINPTTTSLGNGYAVSGAIGGGYDWMNKTVNMTPVKQESCPAIEVDVYKDGFKVARQTSFFITAGLIASKWFPTGNEAAGSTAGVWTSVGVGPIKSRFGIYFTDAETEEQIPRVKKMKLPQTNEEISKWNVKDAAYWEDQGGVAFYMGTGYFPFDVGVFAVATGGWSNYLQKTGPNKVYVERSKKHIKSVQISTGVPLLSVAEQRIKESSSGFSFEFTLDNEASIEAFERFMGGDVTKAQELSKIENSGVMQIADLLESKSSKVSALNIGLPFPFPLSFFNSIFSLRYTTENSYSHFEENSVWDEKLIKDFGLYEKKKSSKVMGRHLISLRSFVGGNVKTDLPGNDKNPRLVSERIYGNFKYSYQADWGQEDRLRKYVDRAKSLTGLTEETCVKVPEISHSLKFNQVVLELNLSDEYLKEIIGKGKSDNKEFINKLERLAQFYYAQKETDNTCKVAEESENVEGSSYDDTCSATTSGKITEIFDNLRAYADNMKVAYGVDKNEFTKNLVKFGKEVWKSPFVFKAVYEKGKVCGEEFTYEVSGRRITRQYIKNKYVYRPTCVK